MNWRRDNMAKASIPPKFCPHCKAFFRGFTADTCPQCMQDLDVMQITDVDDHDDIHGGAGENARRGMFAQAGPEGYRLRDQLLAGLLFVVFAIAITFTFASMISISRRDHPQAPPKPTIMTNTPDVVMPTTLGSAKRVTLTGQPTMPPGQFPVILALYEPGDIDVIAAPSDLNAADMRAFKLACSIRRLGQAKMVVQDAVDVNGARYTVSGPTTQIVSAAKTALLKTASAKYMNP